MSTHVLSEWTHVQSRAVALSEVYDTRLIWAVKVLIKGHLGDAHRNVWVHFEDLEHAAEISRARGLVG